MQEYPDINHNTVQKLLRNELVFPDYDKAVKYINNFLKRYNSSKSFPLSTDGKNVWQLWIRDYDIEGEELQRGYAGNFAKIAMEKRGDAFEFTIEKIPVELSRHPKVEEIRVQKRLSSKVFPFINHSTLQKILKGKAVYDNHDTAKKFFRYFTTSFDLSKHESADEWQVWVHDYDLTEDERQEGYCGNFAKISLVENAQNQVCFKMEKLSVDLKDHPRQSTNQDGESSEKDHERIDRKLLDIRMRNVEEIIFGNYLYVNYDTAKSVLNGLMERFIVSSEYITEEPDVAFFWIRGFGISQHELTLGYKGNFGKVIVYRMTDDSYGVRLEKFPTDLRTHPEKNRPVGRHPDLGEYLIREIRKTRRYKELSEVETIFFRLRMKYPKACRMISKKELLVNIYSIGFRDTEGRPIKSHLCKIESEKDQYYISMTERDKVAYETELDNGFYSTFFLEYMAGNM